MRLLLDTHIALTLLAEDEPDVPLDIVSGANATLFASVVSIWEIAIKFRLGKLRLGAPLPQLPDLLREMGCTLLTTNEQHVLAELNPEPQTRDPFDRLLLAQCQVENLRLVTLDRALAEHPLTRR